MYSPTVPVLEFTTKMFPPEIAMPSGWLSPAASGAATVAWGNGHSPWPCSTTAGNARGDRGVDRVGDRAAGGHFDVGIVDAAVPLAVKPLAVKPLAPPVSVAVHVALLIALGSLSMTVAPVALPVGLETTTV